MGQHASAAFVGKRHIVKADVAAHVLERLCVRAVLDLRLDVHDLAKARKARHAEDVYLRKRRKALERLNERRNVQRKRNEQNRIKAALVDQVTAQRQHDEVEHGDEELHAAVEERHVAIEPVLRVDESGVAALKLIALIAFVRKRLCDPRAGDRGFDIRVDFSDAFLHLERGIAHLDPQPHHVVDRHGYDAEKREREPPIHKHHHGKRAENRRAGDQHVLRAMVRKLRDVE